MIISHYDTVKKKKGVKTLWLRTIIIIIRIINSTIIDIIKFIMLGGEVGLWKDYLSKLGSGKGFQRIEIARAPETPSSQNLGKVIEKLWARRA